MESMSLLNWSLAFAVVSLLFGWVVFWGGAERLEGSVVTAFLLPERAFFWSAYGLRLFAGLNWAITGIWFTIGVLLPEARPPWF